MWVISNWGKVLMCGKSELVEALGLLTGWKKLNIMKRAIKRAYKERTGNDFQKKVHWKKREFIYTIFPKDRSPFKSEDELEESYYQKALSFNFG